MPHACHAEQALTLSRLAPARMSTMTCHFRQPLLVSTRILGLRPMNTASLSRSGVCGRRTHAAEGPVRTQESRCQDRPAGAPEPELCSPSTSYSQSSQGDAADQAATSMASAPIAALSLSNVSFGKLKKQFNSVKDRIYYGDILPPVGSQQLSYARFMDLMHDKKVKRVILLSDGKIAMVEIPVEGYASKLEEARFNRQDEEIMHAPQRAEEAMEKYRFYVELPGDFWENSEFMEELKLNIAPARGRDGRIAYKDLLQVGQVHTELMVMDPGDANVWLNQYSSQLLPIVALIGLRLFVGLGDRFLRLVTKPKKDPMQELAEEFGRHRAREFNVGVERRDTGVRFEDVAGIDDVKADIEEVMKMILGDAEYRAMGARPPRGILLEGPPGTGKTYLAKAMAGSSEVAFFSANGSEFVEMFEGVAAARIRDLFAVARKNAPAIVFIDEIDAIGKARGNGSGDAGTQEREQGLMQMLYEMDGFASNDGVLVVGATNRVNLLDDALLRKGRFDMTIYMGRPSTNNRFKILQVHAKDKPIPRGGNTVWESDALLHRVAELTIGMAGADLANLLNEASILMVRKDMAEIDMGLIQEAMDKRQLGLPNPRLPPSEAKTRMATVQAARAVASCLTPGLPPLMHVSIQPRGHHMSRMTFLPQEFGKHGDEWHRLYAGYPSGVYKVNAVEMTEPLAPYEMLCGLLVPLYVPRVTEEVLYGRRGVTLQTSREVSRAGDLADWLVRKSLMHPHLRGSSVMYDMDMGGHDDPTTRNAEVRFEDMTLQLQRAAYQRAHRLVRERRPVIEQVGRELLEVNAEGLEQVEGHRVVELLATTPVVPLEEPSSAHLNGSAPPTTPAVHAPLSGGATFVLGSGRSGVACFSTDPAEPGTDWETLAAEDADLRTAAEVVVGRSDLRELTALGMPRVDAAEVRIALESDNAMERLRAVRNYGRSWGPEEPEFPPGVPEVPPFKGPLLEQWIPQPGPEVEVLVP